MEVLDGGVVRGESSTLLVRFQPKPSCGVHGSGVDSDLRITTPGVWPSCVTLGRLLSLSGPSVPHLQKRG